MQANDSNLTNIQRARVINLLNRDLGDAYLLLVKTDKYHWDTVGSESYALQQLWEQQHTALVEHINLITRRIKSLGGHPISIMGICSRISPIKPYFGGIPLAKDLVSRLALNRQRIARNLRKHVNTCSEKCQDTETGDFLLVLIREHEQMTKALHLFIEAEATPLGRDRSLNRELSEH